MVNLGLSDAEVKAVISYLKSIEKQMTVSAGIPSEYFPTILISILLLIGITLVGLRVGKKESGCEMRLTNKEIDGAYYEKR
jgi:hypothetical protein